MVERLTAGVALWCVFAPGQNATAQSYNYYDLSIANSMATAQLSQSIFNDMIAGEVTREAIEESSSNSSSGTNANAAPEATTTTAGTTTFEPVGGPMAPARLAKDFAKKPGDRDKMQKFFAQLLETYKEILRNKGVPENDVARAASFAISASYGVLKQYLPADEREFDGVRAQIRQLFSTSEKFQRLSDRQRQELYEGYAIVGMFVSTVESLPPEKRDPAMVAESRRFARVYLEQLFGVPAEKLRLTAKGIEF
jgi:hypothetical protein